ncbi:MAG: hypothetical protein ACPGN3_02710 [Opitutales bacterium]
MESDRHRIGILTIAFGKRRFIKQAENLAISLKEHMPELPIALVTDNPDYRNPHFQEIIPLDKSLGRGVVQKLHLHTYSPFEETLFIDADSLCLKPFTDQLEAIRKHGFSPIWSGFKFLGQSDPYLEDLDFTLKTLGIERLAKFNGGVYYFDRSPFAKKVIETAHQIHERCVELKIRNFDSGGPNDETVYGLALEIAGREAYNAWGKFMKTPIRAIKPVRLDPKANICEFVDKHGLQQPAILHFAGPWTSSLEYKFCAWYFRNRPSDTSYRIGRAIFRSLQALVYYPCSRTISLFIYLFKLTRQKKTA